MDRWQYKTFLTNDLSESTLVERLNQEGAGGWELVTIQALEQNDPPNEGTLPGLSSHAPTGDYLVVLKKRLEQSESAP